MAVCRLLLYFSLLSLSRLKNGNPLTGSARKTLKRIIAYNILKREWQKKRMLLELARRRKPRRWWQMHMLRDRTVHGAWFALVPVLREHDRDGYFNFLKMTPECFDWLLENVRPLMKKRKKGSITPGERLAVTLRYLASGDSQISLSYLFRISDRTISNILLETTYAIYGALRNIVYEPLTEDFWRARAAEFEAMWNFPMCVGAIDGKHVFVQKFAKRGSEYWCCKDMNSIVLMAVADAKYRFIAVDVGARGRESDGGVVSRSDFGILYENDRLNLPPDVYRQDLKMSLPYVFIADDAFTFDKHLMKPYGGDNFSLDEPEVLFNYRLSRARRVVENAFGIMASKFRLFRKPIIGSETLTVNCILAATSLHNLLLSREDCIPPQQCVNTPAGHQQMYKKNGRVKHGRYRNEDANMQSSLFTKLSEQVPSRRNDVNAEIVRDNFKTLFVADPVPWQWSVLFDA